MLFAQSLRYLTDLTFQLTSTRRKSRGIKRLLKTKNVSDAIKSYQERVCAIKGDFLIRTAIDSRFVISDIKNGLKTNTDALASAIETSQRHTVSDIDKNTGRICEEIGTWGVLQSQKADKLSADVQTLKERGSYKGFVRDILPGDIYLGELLPSSDGLGPPGDTAAFSDYHADVDNVPKIVRVYQRLNEKDVMKQFYIDVERLISLKHQNIAQIFGVCRSPDFPAIILHGTTRDTIRNHHTSLTAIQLLRFYTQLFTDLELTSDYLEGFTTSIPRVGPML
ncbi:hypothetical protein ARMGADRAFT_669555 [Armillaria gallica]|uniref:Protein kinase domain-containing protein n=1 Tax=Armillaria gallica TaxID=47427 RepID=A0A2H3CPW9_ARMGA|nr:hypothetical protein ARMGADRAFT_669555 [Armillaria gallica]